MITHIDSAVGTIVGDIRERRELANTWIVFTSDHGDQLFEHGNFAKGDFFPGSTNVPLIVVPPASWREAHPDFVPGRVDTAHPAGLADIMPTLLEAAAIPESEHPDAATQAGQSLVPLLRNPDASFREFTFGHCTTCYGATDARYTYMWFGDSDQEFLFDRERDPLHEHDLLLEPQYGEAVDAVAERFRDALSAYLRDNDDPHADAAAPLGRKPIAVDWKLERGESVNLWNNRGRH
jgi:arylsulfatase A-like enzyme